jgi:hypothetical protein
MLRGIMVSAVLVALTSTAAIAQSEFEVKDRGNGIYVQRWPKPFIGEVDYYVDAIAQLCFTVHYADDAMAFVAIPCSSLARRKEWSKILAQTASTSDR